MSDEGDDILDKLGAQTGRAGWWCHRTAQMVDKCYINDETWYDLNICVVVWEVIVHCSFFGHVDREQLGLCQRACDPSDDFFYRRKGSHSVQCQLLTMFLANSVPLGKCSLWCGASRPLWISSWWPIRFRCVFCIVMHNINTRTEILAA